MAGAGAPLKISNTWAWVVMVGSVCLTGMIVALALAGWPTESIVGLMAGLSGVLTAAAVAVRKGEVVEAKTDQQSEHLDAQTNTLAEIQSTMGTVARRVNGELDDRIARAMEEAAEMGAARAVAALRQDLSNQKQSSPS